MSNDSPYHSLTSWDSHTPRILIIGVVVILAVALVYYFSLPGHGDRSSLPPDLGIAIRDHFRDNESRGVDQMTSYKCNSFDDGGEIIQAPDNTVEVVLENRPARPEEDERTKRWVVLAKYKGDRQWELNAIQREPGSESANPCKK